MQSDIASWLGAFRFRRDSHTEKEGTGRRRDHGADGGGRVHKFQLRGAESRVRKDGLSDWTGYHRLDAGVRLLHHVVSAGNVQPRFTASDVETLTDRGRY